MTGKLTRASKVEDASVSVSGKAPRIRPLCHEFARSLREALPIALIGCFALLVLIPFGTAAVPGDSIFEIAVTHDQMKFRFIANAFVPPTQGFVVLFGFATGFALFRFVLDPPRAETWFSLGIKRSGLYASRCMAGALLMFLAIAVPLCLSLVLNLLALGMYQGLLAAWIYLTVGLFLTALVPFCLAAMGCLLAGRSAEALFFGVAWLALPYAFFYAAGAFMKVLLPGSPFGASPYVGPGPLMPTLADILAPLNPFLFFFEDLQAYCLFLRPLETALPPAIQPHLLVGWTLVVFALVIVGLFFMQRRKVEQAGFLWKRPAVLHLAALVPSLLICALVFEGAAVFALWFGSVLAVLLFAGCLFGAAHLARNKRSKRHAGVLSLLVPILAKTAVLAVLVAASASGFGYYGVLPGEKDITSVQVSSVGTPSLLGVPAYGSSSEAGYYFSALITYERVEEIAQVRALHELFAAEPLPSLAKGTSLEDTVVPYDVQFTYTLGDGTTKTWYYDRTSFAQLAALLALDKTETAGAARAYALGGEASGKLSATSLVWARTAYEQGSIFLTDPAFSEQLNLKLTTEDRLELLQALRADEAALSFEERYYPVDKALGILMFTLAGEEDLASWQYHLNNTFVFLSSAHTETLMFLQEHDLWLPPHSQGTKGAAEVERMVVQPYDPYIGMNAPTFPQSPFFMSYVSERADLFWYTKDFGAQDEVRNPEEREEILAEMRSSYYLTEPGSFVAVKYKDSAVWVYTFWPSEERR